MVAAKIIFDLGRKALKLSLVVVLLSLAVVLLLGKVPVGIEYGSPYRGMPDASLTRWQMLRPDPNIDHRRVLNLERFFGRSGWSLEVTKEKDCYFPGDIVTCLIGGEIPHVMIVSDRKSQSPVCGAPSTCNRPK